MSFTVYTKRTENLDLLTDQDWVNRYLDLHFFAEDIEDIFINHLACQWEQMAAWIADGTEEDAQRIGETVIRSLRNRMRAYMISEAQEQVGYEA